MIKARELPSVEYLRECFHYDSESGELYWKERPLSHFHSEPYQKKFNTIYSGRPVGGKPSVKNYKRFALNGRAMLCHRVIWKIVYEEDPLYVDHIDGDRHNNRIENLRSIPFRENSLNQAKSTKNTSGVVGVYWEKERNLWRFFNLP